MADLHPPKESGIVEFVGELPRGARPVVSKYIEIRAKLAGRPGEWAKIHAPGGWPRERLKTLGCEVRVVKGETFARWPNNGARPE